MKNKPTKELKFRNTKEGKTTPDFWDEEPETWEVKSNFGRRDDYTNESSYRKKNNKYYKEKPPHR